MKRTMTTFFLLVALLAQSINLHSQKHKTAILNKVEAIFTSHFNHKGAGGALVVLQDNNVVFKKTMGLANIEYQVPVTHKTVFNIASNSKQFTSLLALILVNEGKLSLHDDIRKHLPELTHIPHKVSIAQLTNHTHGLPNVDELAYLKGIDRMTHQETLNMLFNIKQFNFKPGDDYQYNNTGYVLLSEIITRVGRKPFADQLKEKIFDKFEMNDSQAVGDYKQIIPNKAYSYAATGNGYRKHPVKISTMGSSGIYTSLNDLITWSKKFLSSNNPYRAHLDTMKVPTILNSGKKIAYGMGLQFENYKGIDILFHGGGTEGYRSYVLHAPKHNLSLVFLSNAGGFSGYDVTYKVLETILKAYIHSPKETSSTKDVSAFKGTYELYPGNYYDIIGSNDSLSIQIYGTKEKAVLPRIGTSTFKGPWPFSKLIFQENGFHLRWADFSYPAKKINPISFKNKDIDLTKFTGNYTNKAFNVRYEIKRKEHTLIIQHPLNGETVLVPFSETSMYAKNSSFGKIDFIIDDSGEIEGFTLSRQNLQNLLFTK